MHARADALFVEAERLALDAKASPIARYHTCSPQNATKMGVSDTLDPKAPVSLPDFGRIPGPSLEERIILLYASREK